MIADFLMMRHGIKTRKIIRKNKNEVREEAISQK